MASSIEPPAYLKSKLSRVELLLDGAGKRLQEDASRCEIFATKASASGSSSLQNNGDHNVPKDYAQTMSDITTLKSVLSCPIFNRIVNVTDSLDKLSYQLNLHPSIGPTDIDIDANGELILTPPIEPAALNNFVNSKLEELVDHSNGNSTQNIDAPQFMSPDIIQGNKAILQAQNQITRQQIQQNSLKNLNGVSEVDNHNGFSYIRQPEKQTSSPRHNSSQATNVPGTQSYIKLQDTIATSNPHNNQGVAPNDAEKSNINGNIPVQRNEDSTIEKNPRVNQFNGDFISDRVVLNNNVDTSNGFHGTQFRGQIGDEENNARSNGYSNELYKGTHELANQGDLDSNQHQVQMNGQQYNSYSKTVAPNQNLSGATTKVQTHQNPGVTHNRGSCSPSTSVGSTVRLADECDSGASSYQSHTAKVTSHSPFLYKSTDRDTRTGVRPNSQENMIDSMEQELENLSPELERITVTLTKEDNSLGITIAGYTCEKEEISGIFIKSITPNSPADRSGKIRILDQIFAVNGRELLGYSNPEAVNVLRTTDKVVTLQLMRYLAESKYRILETAVANAEPVTSSLRASVNDNNLVSHKISAQKLADHCANGTKSSILMSRSLGDGQPPTRLATSSPSGRPTFVEVSNNQQVSGNQPTEGIYKNEIVMNTAASETSFQSRCIHNEAMTPGNQSQIPVAAQRGGTSKVIETKQGARNTIDIRSPVCQTNTATYVNKISEMDWDLDKKSMTARLQREVSEDDFRRLVTSEEPEWEKDAKIIELYKDTDQGLGFTVKEYANPKDQKQSIIMITSLTVGGIAERDGRLSFGDLLIFVDDTNLEGASLAETVKALKRTNGQVRLGVLKLKRT